SRRRGGAGGGERVPGTLGGEPFPEGEEAFEGVDRDVVLDRFREERLRVDGGRNGNVALHAFLLALLCGFEMLRTAGDVAAWRVPDVERAPGGPEGGQGRARHQRVPRDRAQRHRRAAERRRAGARRPAQHLVLDGGEIAPVRRAGALAEPGIPPGTHGQPSPPAGRVDPHSQPSARYVPTNLAKMRS